MKVRAKIDVVGFKTYENILDKTDRVFQIKKGYDYEILQEKNDAYKIKCQNGEECWCPKYSDKDQQNLNFTVL